MADKDKVIGKALYMEFRSGNQTYQMILTPDAVTTEGKSVPSTLYRRQISSAKPRRAWKTYALPKLEQEVTTGTFAVLNKDVALMQSGNRVTFTENTFSRMESYGYKLYKQPIVVEVSQADVADIRSSKTPYKVLGRVTRARKALGFSEKLFE
jgi:hypothetical protein